MTLRRVPDSSRQTLDTKGYEVKKYFCWRCKKDMPFLDEEEWKEIEPLLEDGKQEIVDYRIKHQADIKTARLNTVSEVMLKFEEITGVPDIHFDIISHHRLSDWGPECPKCNNLFRTSKARYCASCGYDIAQNV